ncbi:hypothetical protein KEM55_006758 [Ascosphaera atra]|nr:hypothetical protein KEM55_006758 [Ascosphaera atra]
MGTVPFSTDATDKATDISTNATVPTLTVEPVTYTKWTAWGSDPPEKLSGTNCDAYFVWRFALESRLQVYKPLYPTQEMQVRYVMQQLTNPIFPYVCSWFTTTLTNTGTPPSLHDLFVHIEENYLGVSHLAAQAELQLDEDRVGTSTETRYRMFSRKLRPDITEPLKGWVITQGSVRNLPALLDAARQAENLQHDIDAFQRKPNYSTKRHQYGGAGSRESATYATSTPASDNSNNPNARLRPMATKPQGQGPTSSRYAQAAVTTTSSEQDQAQQPTTNQEN